jgi:glycosyltransferase involved in cell wall biosynthesis
LRVLVDVHQVGGRATGNETWAAQVARAIQRDPSLGPADHVVLAVAHPEGSALATRASVVRVGTSSASRLALQIPRIVRRERIDAVLVQYTVPVSRVPSVLAIHDLSFTDPASSAWIRPAERARMNATIRWSARRAGRILALSEHTAGDLCAKWGVARERIVVAPPAVDDELLARLRARPPGVGGPDGATVLAVGNVLPRKNLVVAARAVAVLNARGTAARLRVVGSVPRDRGDLLAELTAAAGGRVDVTGYATVDQLVSAYHQADVLVFPSLYEGYGLPVIEAMAAGVPVVASEATALPEAVDGAGVLVSPRDPETWADAIERILTDPHHAETLRRLGRERVERLSWRETGRRALDALREVVS